MDKEKTNQKVNHLQSANEKLNVAFSRISSGSSTPVSNHQIPLFSVQQSPNDTSLMMNSNGQVICSKCNCTMDYCKCEDAPRNLRQKACSLTLESENSFIDYANNQLKKNTFPHHEAKRSLSVSVPPKKRKQQAVTEKHRNSKYGEHLNLINVNICPEVSTDISPNQYKKASLQTPSIHISENPLSNNTNCTCSNHTKSLKNDKHQYLCLIHQSDYHHQLDHYQLDRLSSHVYNSQNQYLTNVNGQIIQLNRLPNQSNQLNQRNSITNIPLNLINTSSKTPSKESIYQSDFSPSVASMGKCESIAHSLILSQQQGQTLKRPSFAQISPQNAISNSSTSNNLTGRQDRLFSVGPSFHIQFKHPSQFGWAQHTNLEKKLIITLIILFVLFIVLITGSHLFRSYLNQKNQVCMSSECVKTASALLSAMDLNVDPCQDFFTFACGNWNKNHLISDDRSSISTFEVMADNLQVILKSLLEEAASTYDNSATIKAKTFYKSCMKIEKIEEIHDTPLKELIQNLGGWPVINENWMPVNWKKEELLARLRAELNQGTILEMWIGADDKNSTNHIIQIDQMSLGLPSREYYLKPTSKKERDAYLKLMIELAVLLGGKREYASKEMRKVLDFEIKLANVSMAEADRHDTGAIYRKLTIKELQNIVKEFDWLFYFNKILPIKIDSDEPIVVYSLNYLLEIGKILEQTDVKIVHNYIIWRLVRNITPYLAGDYIQKRVDFRKVLLGISAERVRWTQCVEMVNKRLGMAVGALFIKSHFDPNAKKTALEMIQNIRTAFNELLDENDWMDYHTKQVAKKKANAMNERIGYPNFLTNAMELSNEYTQLQVYEDQFLINIFNLLKFEANKNLAKLRQPVDKNRWTTEPAVVNAYYNPNKNDIVFPAGILQPFFYSAHFPKSLNYGAIGVVIGHEITHGFDNKGRQFDKDGNMHQWWENSTINEFQKRAQCIIDQYSSFVLEDVGLNINGKMTNGENIADNGGLKASYRAFKKFETKSGLSEPLLPGLNMTHDQLFFLNYAQIWCGTMRVQQQVTSIRSSVHSPGPIRVLGPLSNSHEFSKAFSCKKGTRMNPVKKCQIW